MGLIGVPLHITAVVADDVRRHRPGRPVAPLAALPIFVWELSLGIYLVVKGFRPCPITDAMRAAGTPRGYRDVVA